MSLSRNPNGVLLQPFCFANDKFGWTLSGLIFFIVDAKLETETVALGSQVDQG